MVRIFDAGNGDLPSKEWRLIETRNDRAAFEYQSLSLITTSDNSIVMTGTYNDGIVIEAGVPTGANRVAMKTVYPGESYKRQSPFNWVLWSDREFDLGDDFGFAETASVGSVLGGVAAVSSSLLTGPVGWLTGVTMVVGGTAAAEIDPSWDDPNFDAGGGVLIDEEGNLEIWAIPHGSWDESRLSFSGSR